MRKNVYHKFFVQSNLSCAYNMNRGAQFSTTQLRQPVAHRVDDVFCRLDVGEFASFSKGRAIRSVFFFIVRNFTSVLNNTIYTILCGCYGKGRSISRKNKRAKGKRRSKRENECSSSLKPLLKST